MELRERPSHKTLLLCLTLWLLPSSSKKYAVFDGVKALPASIIEAHTIFPSLYALARKGTKEVMLRVGLSQSPLVLMHGIFTVFIQ